MSLSNVQPYFQDASNLDRIGKMVFEEDFDQWLLNHSVWDAGYVGQVYPIRNYHVTTYHDGNVERSVLRIWPFYDKSLDPTAVDSPNGFYRREISTGNMGFRQQYGYFEICAKINRSQGIWPQFLLTHPNGHKINFMEAFTEAPYVDADLNPVNYRMTNYGSEAVSTLEDAMPMSLSRRLDTGFHLYACEWSPEYVKFYFDGKLVATHWHAFQLVSPLMISIRLWYAGLTQTPDLLGTAQGVENALEIDHVRTWLLKDFGYCTGPAAVSGVGTLVFEGVIEEAETTASPSAFISLEKYQSAYSLASVTVSAPAIEVGEGDLIVVVVRYNGPGTAETITDTLGNVYVSSTRSESGTAFSMRVFWKIASAAHAANVVTLSLNGTRGERVLEVFTFKTNAAVSFDTDAKAFASDADVTVSLTTSGKGLIIAATGTDVGDGFNASGFDLNNDFAKVPNASVDFTLATPTALSIVGIAQTGGAVTHNLTFTGTANPSERCMHMISFVLGALL